MENKLTAVNSANTNFKMYKSGKRWLFACSMIVSSLAAMGVATSVHADTTTTNNSGAQPQVTQKQANTNSSTNTSTSSTAGNNATGNSIAASLKSAGGNGSNQTIKTYPNKSEIDQAVNQAKQQPNLVVKQDPDQEITGNSQEEINQKIKDDYAKQQADLKNKEAQAKEAAIAKKNYDNYNNSKGDTTQLDKAVKDGQSVPGLTIKKDADQQSSFKATDSEGIRNWGTNTQSDYESQSNAIQKAIATQKRYNEQKAEQAAKDAAVKAMKDAISKGAAKIPSAYASNVKADFSLSSQTALMNQQIILNNNGPLSFDIDVSGLKAGDKIHIADFKINSNSNYFNGNNDFMFMDNMRLIINGVDYGAIRLSNWGNGNNGGDQFPDQLYKTNNRDTYELYAVMDKDYQGIGKQHVEVTNSGTLRSINFEVGPQAFQGINTLNGTISLVEHDGKTVTSRSFTLTRPSQQAQENAPDNPNNADYYNDVWTGNGTGGFGPALNWRNAGSPYTGQGLNSSVKLNAPDAYTVAAHVSTTASTIRQYKVGEHFTNSIELRYYVIGSDGKYHGEGKLFTSNLKENMIDTQVVSDGQSEAQLLSQLDKSQAYGLASYQSDGSLIYVINIPKEWYQTRVKEIVGNKDKLLATYNAWNIATDPNPDQALKNTMDYYAQNSYAPAEIIVWGPGLTYLNPQDSGTSTVSWHSVGAPNQNSVSTTKSVAKPLPSTLIYGQSGIKVHYIDGSTGKDMRQISNSIGDPNKTTSVIPQEIAGYDLTTEGAKGIPLGAQTVETKTDVSYPKDGTWKDVYIVYMPYLPTGTTTAHYHYDTAKISRIPGTDNVNATYHYDYTNYNPSTEKHFTDGSKIADNQVFSDGSVVTANIKATLPVAADIDGGLKSYTITEDYSNFAKYVNKGTFKVMNGTQDVTSQWSVKDDGNGKAVLTLIDPSKANGETVTVEPMWTINTDVPNGTEFVNNATATVNDVPGTPSTSKITTFTQQPTKDVEMGDNVQGDTPNSINGQVVAAGSTVTYPLSDKNGLPANREQQVTSHVITDNLDSALNYVSYKAYLPDSNGKLQDVTSHVLLTKDGQNLTFTDDSYLLGLYNQDPSVAFALPIIDLVVKANNDTKVIPNNFNSTFTYKDNNGTSTEKKTSNTVNISTYTPTATKDVELGDDVQGDTSNTIAGSLVEAGTLVTWPMSTKSLPANRAQDVVSHTETENFDSNLSFVSFKAYLPDKDGKLQDVTSHVQMKQDGQKLTFTDDATLIKQYNADKKAEQSLPVIDLVTKVNGQSKLIPNDFDSQLVFKDGKGNTTLKTTSNKVSIKTATAPNPVKEDLNDHGKNIDGQEVNENQHLTMQLDWDLSNDKGVNATPEMIKKGFYFADPLDAKALEAGDLSKAQVLDQNGNKVSGISFHKYNSLSEAPEFIQEQIKDNDLAARFNGPFVVAQADDPQAFYDKYVKTGSKLKVQIPVTVKKGFKGSFSNTAYQFGFGKATPTNTVTNFVKPTPKQETPKPTTPTATPVATPTAPAAAPEQLSAPVSQQQPEAQQSQLPQTGNTNDAAIFGLAAAALIGSASLAGLDLRKHN